MHDGERIRARNVISNADPHVTYGKLLPPGVCPREQAKARRMRYSVSLLSVFAAVDMDLRHLVEGADQVDHRIGAFNRLADAVRLGDILPDEAVSADGPERLDEVRGARVAARDTDPRSRLEQLLADVAADEAAASEDGDELIFAVDHRAADSGWRDGPTSQ